VVVRLSAGATVGGLLVQRLRDEVVLRRRRSTTLMAARFDYTPPDTHVDTDLALVSDVYELMADIYPLMLSLRGVDR